MLWNPGFAGRRHAAGLVQPAVRSMEARVASTSAASTGGKNTIVNWSHRSPGASNHPTTHVAVLARPDTLRGTVLHAAYTGPATAPDLTALPPLARPRSRENSRPTSSIGVTLWATAST